MEYWFRSAVFSFSAMIMMACMEKTVYVNKSQIPQNAKIHVVLVQDSSSAPGMGQVIYQQCRDALKFNGLNVVDSSQALWTINIDPAELRYKRGIGEEPITNVRIEIKDSMGMEHYVVRYALDGIDFKFWRTRTLSAQSFKVCQDFAHEVRLK